MAVKQLLLITTMVFIMVQITFAQSTIDAEIRPRFQYQHGYRSIVDTSQAANVFIDQRTRINFRHKTKGLEIRISLQDVRTWGSQNQVNATDGLTSIHEAWGESFINDKLSVKFGRQESVLDDRRIFGNSPWAQQARRHDALILKIKPDSTFQIHIAGAYNQGSFNYNTNNSSDERHLDCF